jgi:hypothetical protein
VDKQFEEVNKKVHMLHKEKERFAMKLEEKRKASKNLENSTKKKIL